MHCTALYCKLFYTLHCWTINCTVHSSIPNIVKQCTVCTVLYTLLYPTLLNDKLYCTLFNTLHCQNISCTVLYFTLLYFAVLYFTVLYTLLYPILSNKKNKSSGDQTYKHFLSPFLYSWSFLIYIRSSDLLYHKLFLSIFIS